MRLDECYAVMLGYVSNHTPYVASLTVGTGVNLAHQVLSAIGEDAPGDEIQTAMSIFKVAFPYLTAFGVSYIISNIVKKESIRKISALEEQVLRLQEQLKISTD